MPKMIIRRAAIGDAEGIHRAHMISIQEICSKDHSRKEIQVWGHRPYREDQRVRSIKNDFVWVVDVDGVVEGYGHLQIFEKEGSRLARIMGLYLTPKALGQSVGKTMIELMMKEIRAAGVRQVSLESTLTARGFYRKAGFVDVGPETTIEISGVPVRCYPMKMTIGEELGPTEDGRPVPGA